VKEFSISSIYFESFSESGGGKCSYYVGNLEITRDVRLMLRELQRSIIL
jgi:hypothetical protein